MADKLGQPLVLELFQSAPAIFSANAATLGIHRTLARPTGAALMGWVASQIYGTVKDPLGFFHSGRVAFSDAVWLDGGRSPVFANPAILMEAKNGGGETGIGHADYSAKAANSGRQPVRVKNKWVTLSGRQVANPVLTRRTRTAVEAGKAAQSQLFELEMIAAAGSVYRAVISGLSEDERDALKQVVHGQTILLGKQRNTGHGGHYVCTVVEGSPWPTPELADSGASQIRFWLLSDCLLSDGFGGWRVEPIATDFGLTDPAWQLDWSETGLTHRRVWPRNAAFDSPDMEHPVLEAGSVVTFCRMASSGGQLQGETALKPLVGTGHERGYGRYTVLVDANFDWPHGSEPTACPVSGKLETVPGPDSIAPPSLLARWANDRAMAAQAQTALDISFARRFAVSSLPGTTQWHKLTELIEYIGQDDLRSRLVQALAGDAWSDPLRKWVTDSLFGEKPQPLAIKRTLNGIIARVRREER